MCILSVAQWSYKIGDKIFCGYSCKHAELSEEEEKDRKREEANNERKQEYDRAYKALKYRSDKSEKSVKPYKPKTSSYHTRAVLKINALDGRVVEKFPSVRAAAVAEYMTIPSMSRRINGKHKRS